MKALRAGERGLRALLSIRKYAQTSMEPPKYIDSSRVKEVLKYEDLFPVIEEALLNFSTRESGGIVQPVRTAVQVEDHGYILFYLCIRRGRCRRAQESFVIRSVRVLTAKETDELYLLAYMEKLRFLVTNLDKLTCISHSFQPPMAQAAQVSSLSMV